jgi:GNAT superfamily N-acetyltransferase
MNATFERASATDTEALVKVQIRAFHDDARIYPGVEIGGPPGYDSVEHTRHKIEQTDFYKIEVNEEIIGGIVVFDQGGGHFHLDLLYLDPDYHNQGIGSQAMQFIELTYAASKWSLDTPLWAVRNHHFYEKFGYIKVGEVQEESAQGITLVVYEKQS